MMKRAGLLFKIAWISLTVIGTTIFIFGLIVAIWPGSSDARFSSSDWCSVDGNGGVRGHDHGDPVQTT